MCNSILGGQGTLQFRQLKLKVFLVLTEETTAAEGKVIGNARSGASSEQLTKLDSSPTWPT